MLWIESRLEGCRGGFVCVCVFCLVVWLVMMDWDVGLHSCYILVILAVLMGSFQTFWCIYMCFDILVILMSKIFFFNGKIP